jgi:hypothetical protein
MKSLLVAAALLLTACSTHHNSRRLIVLGVDGMDPNFVERHWDALPNLRRLRDTEGFSRLATTTPPQSPVAWSTFSTGLDPAEHGIFDFVHRDPKTHEPVSSFAGILPPAHTLATGPWVLPLSHARVQSFRRGKTFWEVLAGRGVPVTLIRMPANYPPVPGAGHQLAGMGTPDLEGTFGTFTYYSDDPLDIARDVPGGRIVPVAAVNNRVLLPVEGPPNTLRRDRHPVNLTITADIDPEAAAARFQIEDQQFILKQGEWSGWIRVRFPLLDHAASVSGMFRLYAQKLSGGIRIYRSPLNADPYDPALPLSAPAGYVSEIASRIGPFYTQGIEEDTAAVRQNVFSLNEYLRQSRIVHQEHERLLRDALAHFRDGLLFFYFSEIDQDSHLLWQRHEAELLKTYRAVDHSVGEVLAQAAGAEVIVMSDHGFAPFDYAFNLNTWLKRNGFSGQAYALGLNALYVNAKGTAEREAILARLIPRLEAEKPAIDTVSRVPPSSSPYAPDLIVGYAPGYRASWETTLGEAPPEIVERNNDPWIGDHCMAADAVPGVLFARHRVPSLKELSTVILDALQ